jgi:peptidyl-prolyl cis-trans isomerase SurA
VSKRRLLVIAPLGLVLLAGTACGPNQLGAAAIVGDDRITIATVQDSVEKTRALQEEQSVIVRGAALAARSEVRRRVIDLIFLRTAAELGVTATDAEITAVIDANRKELGGQTRFLQALASNGLNEEQVTDVFRTQVLSEKIAAKLAGGQKLSAAELDRRLQEKLLSVASGMRIKINPRYGTFEDGDIVQKAPDYIRAADR